MASLSSRRAEQIVRHVLPSCVAGSTGRFAGQSCIVTGGARGIGRAIADQLVASGARAVCIFDITDGADAVADIQKAGADAFSVKLELSDESQVLAGVAEVIKRFGKVDVLIQAAGITGQTGIKTHEVSTNDFLKVFDVNVKGVFLCAKAVLPSMMEEGYGRIVNIASISGKEGNAGMLAYSASKAAVINLTKVIGKDYATTGKDITCNCVAPAVVQTAMVDAMPPAQVKYMTDKIPMARTGKLDEVASTVLFVASRECSFTTGFCFDASGGRAVY